MDYKIQILFALFFLNIYLDTKNMSDSNTNDDGNFSVTPKKQIKRLVSFNNVWLEKYPFLKPGKNQTTAVCTTCNNFRFDISHNGEYNITRHVKTHTHIENTKSVSKNISISNFFAKKNSKTEDDVTRAEVLFCYHSALHSHSYNSGGCAGPLFKTMFADSSIAAKYACGRTKLAAIITKVLGPYSKSILLKNLNESVFFR